MKRGAPGEEMVVGARETFEVKKKKRSACRFCEKQRKLVVVLPAFDCDSQHMEAITVHKVAK